MFLKEKVLVYVLRIIEILQRYMKSLKDYTSATKFRYLFVKYAMLFYTLNIVPYSASYIDFFTGLRKNLSKILFTASLKCPETRKYLDIFLRLKEILLTVRVTTMWYIRF